MLAVVLLAVATAAPAPVPPATVLAIERVAQTERADCPAALEAYERYTRTHAAGSAAAADRAVHASLPCAHRYAGVERARLLYGLADIELGLASVHDADPNVALPETRTWLREALPLAASDPALAALIRDDARTLE